MRFSLCSLNVSGVDVVGVGVTGLVWNVNMSNALTSAGRTMRAEERRGGETGSTSCFSFSIVSFPTWPSDSRRSHVWTCAHWGGWKVRAASFIAFKFSCYFSSQADMLALKQSTAVLARLAATADPTGRRRRRRRWHSKPLSNWRLGKLPNLQNSAIVFFKELQLLSNREANGSSISHAANLAWQPR